jgi:hypothetical protein
MATQLVSIGFGKETFSVSSASLSAFVVEPPFNRTLPSKKFKRQGALQKFPVSNHPEINGYMYLDSVGDIPDGTIILLQASQRYRATPLRDGAIFIHLRATGPMLAVQATLPSAIESTLTGGFLAFQGRGDILAVDELKTYGIEPYKNYITAYTDDEEVAECYTIQVVSPEIEGKPNYDTVKTPDGEVLVVKAKPRRKMNLRR